MLHCLIRKKKGTKKDITCSWLILLCTLTILIGVGKIHWPQETNPLLMKTAMEPWRKKNGRGRKKNPQANRRVVKIVPDAAVHPTIHLTTCPHKSLSWLSNLQSRDCWSNAHTTSGISFGQMEWTHHDTNYSVFISSFGFGKINMVLKQMTTFNPNLLPLKLRTSRSADQTIWTTFIDHLGSALTIVF